VGGASKPQPGTEIDDDFVNLKPKRPKIHYSFINQRVYSYVARATCLAPGMVSDALPASGGPGEALGGRLAL
jgi:hypothetical protein